MQKQELSMSDVANICILFDMVIQALFEAQIGAIENPACPDSLKSWMKDLLEIKKIAEMHTGK